MATVRVFHVVKPLPRFGSGFNPNLDSFKRVGTVANTTRKSKKKAEKVLVTVHALETRRN